MKRFSFSCLFLCILFSAMIRYAGAQQIVSGTVLDKSTRIPLEDVNVLLLPPKQGAVTDKNGQFVIRNVLPGTYTLSFSRIGYKTEKQNILVTKTKNTILHIYLKKETKRIEEVSVTGHRIMQKEFYETAPVLSVGNIEKITIDRSASVRRWGRSHCRQDCTLLG